MAYEFPNPPTYFLRWRSDALPEDLIEQLRRLDGVHLSYQSYDEPLIVMSMPPGLEAHVRGLPQVDSIERRP